MPIFLRMTLILFVVGISLVAWSERSIAISQQEFLDECAKKFDKATPEKLISNEKILCLFDKIIELEKISAPVGAIMYFESKCPDGWGDFNKSKGRFIISAGDIQSAPIGNREDEKGNTLDSFSSSKVGGVLKYRLDENNLPEHKHGTIAFGTPTAENSRKIPRGWGVKSFDDIKTIVLQENHEIDSDGESFLTSPIGSSKEIRNIPPFLALNMCIREQIE